MLGQVGRASPRSRNDRTVRNTVGLNFLCVLGAVPAQFNDSTLISRFGNVLVRSGGRTGGLSWPSIQLCRRKAQSYLPILLRTCDLVIGTGVVERVFLPRMFATNCSRMQELRGGSDQLLSLYLRNVAQVVTGQAHCHSVGFRPHELVVPANPDGTAETAVSEVDRF
jgi:hypothetical protein